MHINIPDRLAYAALKGLIWLGPVVHVAGMVIAVWAWRNTRKAGYIVVALYFLLAVFSRTFPEVIRVVSRRPAAQAQLTPQLQQEYAREMVAVDKKFFPAGHSIVQTIRFPLGPLVLVAGLWLVARRDVKNQTVPAVATPRGGEGETPRQTFVPLGTAARHEDSKSGELG